MAYCGPRALPLTGFLSWSAADQDAALAWMLDEQERCSSCGTREDDWWVDDDTAPDGRRFDPHAFHAQVRICAGCAARSTAVEGVSERARPHAHVSLRFGPPVDD